MKSLKNKIITALTAVYLLATPACNGPSTSVDKIGTRIETRTELVASDDSKPKSENLNNKVKYIVNYKSKVTGLDDKIESTIVKPELYIKNLFDSKNPFPDDDFFKDKKYRKGINRTIDATIIDGKDTLLMRYSVKHEKTGGPKNAITSIVNLYTIKNGKTKNVWYAYVDQFGIDNSKILLTYYDGNVLNVDEWDEEKYIVSKINLDTKAKAEFIREDKSETKYKYSTVTDDFVIAQKLEFGVGLYYMFEINSRINNREEIRKQELEKKEQDRSKELYDKQKSSIQKNSMW